MYFRLNYYTVVYGESVYNSDEMSLSPVSLCTKKQFCQVLVQKNLATLYANKLKLEPGSLSLNFFEPLKLTL